MPWKASVALAPVAVATLAPPVAAAPLLLVAVAQLLLPTSSLAETHLVRIRRAPLDAYPSGRVSFVPKNRLPLLHMPQFRTCAAGVWGQRERTRRPGGRIEHPAPPPLVAGPTVSRRFSPAGLGSCVRRARRSGGGCHPWLAREALPCHHVRSVQRRPAGCSGRLALHG
jgi:hypothetical protein